MALAKEQAFACPARGVRAGLTLRGGLLRDTDLDPTRSDPRFEAVLRSLG